MVRIVSKRQLSFLLKYSVTALNTSRANFKLQALGYRYCSPLGICLSCVNNKKSFKNEIEKH